jgi:hypothetical protein
MGQIEGALVCYQKSALIVEKHPMEERVRNQGYIRAWIGEVLVAREQFKLADVFFRAAHTKWEQAFPTKAASVLELSNQVRSRVSPSHAVEPTDAERTCLDWILGRNLDSRFN